MSATFRAASTPSKLQFTSSSSIASISPLNTTNARLHSTVAFTARTSVLSVRSERSYIMIKPDGVQRGLVGGIISRFENKGFKLVGLKMFQCTKAIAEEHYKDLSSKPFFPDLVDYIISGPVICMIWEGNGVVKSARKLIGATNPLESEPGTIRGDLAIQTGRNVVHGSDSPENGEREIGLWFKSEEILAWNSVMMPWLTE
jgi:nucleoside-diphosphate kinase